MLKLANCSNCNAVFAKTTRDICPECYQAEERAFETVYRFLSKRKNRSATIPEIVEETEVSEELIIKFIRNKRLRASDFPNIGYPCEMCGEQITKGKLCKTCATNLRKQYAQQEELDEREARRREEEKRAQAYVSFRND